MIVWLRSEARQPLGLKVNITKTKITRPRELKYLGFGFWKSSDGWKSRPHQDSVRRFKLKLKKLTQRKWSIDLTRRIEQLNLSIRGWINYFSLGNMKSIVTSIDERLRTRLRVIIWKQWKKKSRRLWGLLKLGVPKWIADKVSGWGDHYQLIAQKSVLKRAISKPVLEKRGLVSCLDYYLERHALKVSWTAVCRTARTVVWEGIEIIPYSIMWLLVRLALSNARQINYGCEVFLLFIEKLFWERFQLFLGK